MRNASYVIVPRGANVPLVETYDRRTAALVRRRHGDKFEVWGILQWLQRVNRDARKA